MLQCTIELNQFTITICNTKPYYDIDLKTIQKKSFDMSFCMTGGLLNTMQCVTFCFTAG